MLSDCLSRSPLPQSTKDSILAEVQTHMQSHDVPEQDAAKAVVQARHDTVKTEAQQMAKELTPEPVSQSKPEPVPVEKSIEETGFDKSLRAQREKDLIEKKSRPIAEQPPGFWMMEHAKKLAVENGISPVEALNENRKGLREMSKLSAERAIQKGEPFHSDYTDVPYSIKIPKGYSLKGEQYVKTPNSSEPAKSTTQILHDNGAVKLTVPPGASMIRVTDAKGRQTVERVANVGKGANVLQGAGPYKRVEAGTMATGGKFVPMKGEVLAEPRETIGAASPRIPGLDKKTLYRASDNPEAKAGAHFSENEEDARAYQDNPGFGGSKLHQFSVDASRVADIPKIRDLAKKLEPLLDSDQKEWADQQGGLESAIKSFGFDHVFHALENSFGPRGSKIDPVELLAKDHDWIRFNDDYPAGAKTWRYIGGDSLTPEGSEPVLHHANPLATNDEYEALADKVYQDSNRTSTEKPKPTPAGRITMEPSIREAYDQLVKETGYLDVPIADLMERVGFAPGGDPMAKAKGILVAMNQKGDATFGGGDWSLSDNRTRAWNIVNRNGDLMENVRLEEPEEGTIGAATPRIPGLDEKTYYRGTRNPSMATPDEAGVTWFTNDKEAASRYSLRHNNSPGSPQVFKSSLTPKNTLDLWNDLNGPETGKKKLIAILKSELPDSSGLKSNLSEIASDHEVPIIDLLRDPEVTNAIKKAGYDAVRIRDDDGIGEHDSIGILSKQAIHHANLQPRDEDGSFSGGPNFIGAANPLKAAHDKMVDLANQVKEEAAASSIRDQITSGHDAIGTLANVAGEQARNAIRLDFTELHPSKPNETRKERKARESLIKKDLVAARMVVESGGDKAKLDDEEAKISVSPDQKLKDKFLPIVQHARENFDAIQSKLEGHTKLANETYDRLIATGEDFGKRENYVHRVTIAPPDDDAVSPLFEMGSGQSQSPKGMEKSRAFDTIGDAVKAAYDPGTYGLHEADQRMVANAEKIIGSKAFLDKFRNTKMPDGLSIISEMEKVTRPNGAEEEHVPSGYEVVPVMGRPLVIHKLVAGLFKALYGKSALRAHYAGRALLKLAAWSKTYSLVGDTFHMGRTMYKALSGGGSLSIKQGLALIQYTSKDLDRALKNGEITQSIYDAVKSQKPLFEEGLKQGLNIGRIADNLVEQARTHVPGLQWFTDFLFGKMTRSYMANQFIKFAKRNISSGEFKTHQEAIRQAAKETNELFGNLQNQGIFQDKTMQDISRIVLLAPQWTESQFKNEARGYAQAAKAAYNFVRSGGKKRFLGNTALATALGTIGMLALNQIINYITRKQSTFQNEEEGHKLDAFIPGGKRGFWFDPFEISAEYAHAAEKYLAQHENPVDVATHIASNKLSPIARGAKDALTGRDYSGRHFLSNTDRFRAAAVDALPSPMFLGGNLEKDPRQPLGYRLNRQPGSGEKQILQSFGAKVTAYQSPRSQMFAIAQPFRADRAPNDSAGEYTQLRQALDNDDKDSSQSEIKWLLGRGKTVENIKSAVGLRKDDSVKPETFAGSSDREADMLASLNPQERKVYDQAQADHIANARKLQDYLRDMSGDDLKSIPPSDTKSQHKQQQRVASKTGTSAGSPPARNWFN